MYTTIAPRCARCGEEFKKGDAVRLIQVGTVEHNENGRYSRELVVDDRKSTFAVEHVRCAE